MVGSLMWFISHYVTYVDAGRRLVDVAAHFNVNPKTIRNLHNRYAQTDEIKGLSLLSLFTCVVHLINSNDQSGRGGLCV